MEIIKTACYKGTRIWLGNTKRNIIDNLIWYLLDKDFIEIQIPIIQFEETFRSRVGEENNNLMFTLTDRKNRKLCLAPEYTSVIQEIAKAYPDRTMKVFYVGECFRGEKPQQGRYRQFTQFGVEIINPKKDMTAYMKALLWELMTTLDGTCLPKGYMSDLLFKSEASRSLSLYKEGIGFELIAPRLGSSSQLAGGGNYEGGIGFAIGIDRLLLLK